MVRTGGAVLLSAALYAVLFGVLSPPPVDAIRLATPFGQKFHVYVWAGPKDWKKGRDYLVVLQVDLRVPKVSVRWRYNLGTVGNEPHHIGFFNNYKYLFAGGLLSFASGLPSVYFFNVSKTLKPVLLRADVPVNATAADAALALPDGGVLLSLMGGPGGGEGGSLLRYDKHLRLAGQYPPNAGSFRNRTGTPFNPHGIARSNDGKYILSGDFIVPITTVATPIVGSNSLRVFNGSTYAYIKTIRPPAGEGANGFMDVKWVKNVVIASSFFNGKLYWLDPVTNASGLAFDFNVSSAQPHMIFVNNAQTVIYVAAWGLDSVYKFDASNPKKLKALAVAKLPKGAGPHFIHLTPDESVLVVADYFLDETPIGGAVVENGDRKVLFLRTSDLGIYKDLTVDFNDAVVPGVPYQPHGLAILPI